MMGNKKWAELQGAIYRLELLKNMGFTYIRFVLPELFMEQKVTSMILCEVYDLHIDGPNISALSELESKEQIMNTLLLLYPPEGQDLLYWKRVGNIEVDKPYTIPDYVSCSNKNLGKPERFPTYTWQVVKNLGYEPFRPVSYESSKHLGLWQHLSPDLARIRITFSWLKLLGVDVVTLFAKDLQTPRYRIAYNQTFHFPSYAEVPKTIRGKVI